MAVWHVLFWTPSAQAAVPPQTVGSYEVSKTADRTVLEPLASGVRIEVERLSTSGWIRIRVDADADGQDEFVYGVIEHVINLPMRTWGYYTNHEDRMPEFDRIDLFRPGQAFYTDPLSPPLVSLTHGADGNVLIEVDNNQDGRLDVFVGTDFRWPAPPSTLPD